jgi:hypothetical protein
MPPLPVLGPACWLVWWRGLKRKLVRRWLVKYWLVLCWLVRQCVVERKLLRQCLVPQSGPLVRFTRKGTHGCTKLTTTVAVGRLGRA